MKCDQGVGGITFLISCGTCNTNYDNEFCIFRRPKHPWPSEMVAILMALFPVSGAGNEAIQIAVNECFSSACVAAFPADNA